MAGKKAKMQLALEEQELRSLKIPAPGLRGTLSPSKNSFLPTLTEQAQERVVQKRPERKQQVKVEHQLQSAESLQKPGPANIVVELLEDASRIEGIRRQLERKNGVGLDQFVEVMLGQLPTLGAEGSEQRTEQCAQMVQLFKQIDVHGDEHLTWEQVSTFFIEQGMKGGDEFTVDTIKRYESSPTMDQTKHEDVVERLVYVEQIDAMIVLSHNSRKFRLYDPRKCTIKQEVVGHRGTVINACYLEGYHQLASTGADSAICFWDASTLALKNRIATKDVQRCLQWSPSVESLFAGSTDGTLSRWDIQNMCLQDSSCRKSSHKKAINDLLMIKDINLLASASSDATILMWDCASMRPRKQLKGHKKGVYSLAYSPDYHCLLSAGLDQDALVWNPYVEHKAIFRLKGHAHALCGVQVVPGTPQILTADVAGTFRLWDMRNFRCVQAFGGTEQLQDLNTFCAMPAHKRLAAGSSKVFLYDYQEEWGGENVTDAGGVTDALYHPDLLSFFTVSKRSIKVWDTKAALSKVLRDVGRHEITAVCFAAKGRKLYCGDSKGEVYAHSLLSGQRLRKLHGHRCDVSCIVASELGPKVFTAAWDGTVKVQTDEPCPLEKQTFASHLDGVTCMATCPHQQLLASGGTDAKVVLYSLKSLKVEEEELGKGDRSPFRDVIAHLSFLSSELLLAAGDRSGRITLWTRPDQAGSLKCQHAFDQEGGLSVLKFLPAPEAPQLLTADGKGVLRVWGLKVRGVGRRASAQALGMSQTGLSGTFALTGVDTGQEPKRSEAELICEREAHSDHITGLQVCSDPPCVVTCSLDNRVRVWQLPPEGQACDKQSLRPVGGLLQTQDRSFDLGVDQAQRWKEQLEAAQELLNKLEVRPAPPVVERTEEGPSPLLDQRRKDARTSELWQHALEDADLEGDGDGAFHAFFSQLEEQDTLRVDLRLTRHAQEKAQRHLRQRQNPLSQDEATAARRFAQAMASIGDDHGAYARMADSLNPSSQIRVGRTLGATGETIAGLG